MAIVIDTPDGIHFAHVAALRGAVRLEIIGMRRRGRPATAIARQEFGLPKSTSKQEVLDFLTAEIERILDARG